MDSILYVDRGDLVTALKGLKKAVKGSDPGEATVSFDDDCLEIALPEASAGVPASGSWSVQVSIPGKMLLRLIRVLPPQDPVVVRKDDDGLQIGGLHLRGLDEPEKESPDSQAADESQSLIERAAAILAPLGVDAESLRKFIERIAENRSDD